MCDSKVKEKRGEGGARVFCPQCGEYGITDLAIERLLELHTWETERKRLSQALRFASDRGRPVVLVSIESSSTAIAELALAEQSAEGN